jgi:hypothetical protein
MRIRTVFFLTVITTVFVTLPVLAGEASSGKPATTGRDAAMERIDTATAKQVEILTGLLSKVPQQAQPAIEKAIANAQSGHDAAIAALSKDGGTDGSTDVESTADGKPDTTGLQRAREAVAAGFDRSTATLQGLLDKVPSNASSRVEAALERLDSTRTVALRNLDSLIAGQRPEHPASQGHLDRPEHPSRPDRPEHIERPQIPERPERPQVPDHPSPHG